MPIPGFDEAYSALYDLLPEPEDAKTPATISQLRKLRKLAAPFKEVTARRRTGKKRKKKPTPGSDEDRAGGGGAGGGDTDDGDVDGGGGDGGDADTEDGGGGDAGAEDGGDPDGEGPGTADDADMATTASDGLIPHPDAPRLSEDAVMLVILDKQSKLNVDPAMRRTLLQLAQGVPECEDWESVAAPYLAGAQWGIPSFVANHDRSHSAYSERENTLLQSMNAVKYRSAWVSLVHHIEVLQLQSIWNDFSTSQKRTHHAGLFLAAARKEDEDAYAGFTADKLVKQARVDNALGSVFNKYCRMQETETTGRNQLRVAYDLFGLFVLIHPGFHISNLGNKRKGLNGLLEEFEAARDDDDSSFRDRLEQNEHNARYFVRTLLSELHGDQDQAMKTIQYLNTFLREHPASIYLDAGDDQGSMESTEEVKAQLSDVEMVTSVHNSPRESEGGD